MNTYEQPVTVGFFSRIKPFVLLLRPKEWVKNLFLFVPLFFAGALFHSEALLQVALGAIAFSMIASSIYILNDYCDIEKDRLHPKKKHRPLAAKTVSTSVAFVLMGVCVLGGLLIGWSIQTKFFVILLAYLVLNIAYSLGLKNIAILDILIIAAGFVFRIKAGGAIGHVGISQWLMIMVFLLALFLGLAKRRDDILIKQHSGQEMRKSVSGYNIDFLNISLAVVTTIIIVAYLMYTISPEVIARLGTYRLYYTAIFVLAGLMRYLQLVYVHRDTGSPTKILYKDHFIQICLVLWILSFYFILYLKDFHPFPVVN